VKKVVGAQHNHKIKNPVQGKTKNKLKINIQGMRVELVFGASI